MGVNITEKEGHPNGASVETMRGWSRYYPFDVMCSSVRGEDGGLTKFRPFMWVLHISIS